MARTNRELGEKRQKNHSYYDYSLLFLTIFLVCFGLVMIYSTSSYTAQTYAKFNNDPAHFLKKQGAAALLGIAAMLVISKIDYRIYIAKLPVLKINLVMILYITATILQVLVLIFGKEINGAKRWLFGFQPSEISKVAAILFVAYIVNQAPKRLDSIFGFFRVGVYMAPLLGLIVKENLSTAIVIAGIMFVICFVASKKKLYFIIVALVLVGAGVLLIFFVDYRSTRVDIWRDVENHKDGFQILQGLYAIASGGLFGTGLGQSRQKLGFIPEAHNDMIFTIICEELGLFGAVAVIVLFLLVIWRLFIISINAPDLFGGMVVVGVLTHIAVQVIINIAVVSNSIPSTGIPLPFISYGGTSVSILLAEMGLALSVSNQIKHER